MPNSHLWWAYDENAGSFSPLPASPLIIPAGIAAGAVWLASALFGTPVISEQEYNRQMRQHWSKTVYGYEKVKLVYEAVMAHPEGEYNNVVVSKAAADELRDYLLDPFNSDFPDYPDLGLNRRFIQIVGPSKRGRWQHYPHFTGGAS